MYNNKCSSGGITAFRAQGTLARGNTHFPRTSVSPEVHTPKSRPGFREIPYATTVSSLWSYGVSAPKYPARAGVPFRI